MTNPADALWTAAERTEVERLLRAGGWHPGRRVSSQITSWRTGLEAGGGFRLHPAAEAILAEFGGLHVGDNQPGVDRARTDIRFEPAAAWGMEDLLELPELHGRSIFPVGEVTHGHGVLLLDSKGEVFLAMDEVNDRWPSFTTALCSLLLGRTHARSRPNVR